ncbi:MAG: phosphoribosylamine--glycine ligase [bacterium]|nr:phosphoribosylamine--glycine ligase [bacterium]
MKVLLIGGGGREHALAWGIHRSPRLELLRCAPGNAGIAALAECVPLTADDADALVRHAVDEAYDLVVVGPEQPLVDGLADRLAAEGIPVFGPASGAAVLEGSKIFSKEFMQRHGIPTAGFRVFDDADEARAWLESDEARYPLVVKADGLAAGKGVILADDRTTAVEAALSMLRDGAFGAAGSRIVIEEMLVGREASFFVLSDGARCVELATCQDYKRALDGDAGLNTGGMGTYSPSVYLDDATRRSILKDIVQPTIDGLAAEKRPYRGVLFVGLMLTADGPQVLEYNVRFGDPETQVLIPRLDGDWLAVLDDCANGRLDPSTLSWTDESAVCVVMSAGGYPGSYEKGIPIEGLADVDETERLAVFHAGTRTENGKTVTSGGRVLGVTALGRDLAEARNRAYAAAERITWEDERHRTDIALDAVRRLEEEQS